MQFPGGGTLDAERGQFKVGIGGVNEQETARLADCHPWSPHNEVRDRELKADTLPAGRVSSLMCFLQLC